MDTTVDPFTEIQEQRDRYARLDGSIGDLCNRWVTCDRCGWESGVVHFWSEMDREEDDHMMHGCPSPAPFRPEPDGVTWPYPERWIWHHRIEPADETPDIFPGRNDFTRGLGYVAGRRAPIVFRINTVPLPAEEAA